MQIQGKYRCINCFNELNTENEICSCGYDITQYKTAMHRLSPGTVLDNRYYIGRTIGEGGFGITYVGYDANLDIRVAVKEFFLSGINTRNTTYSDEIESSAEEKEELFEKYREKFINEARVLAKFNNEDGIVTVYNFFKANNTAYIIMEFLDGQNLKEYLKEKGKLSADEVIEIFLPIMRTLDKVHKTKLIHRDISPDNIIFTENDKVKLLDFGAAREVSDDNKSLSVVLKHGYAPPEQYQSHGNQGPWTDVYALSATIYKCLTGKTPIEAMDRMLGQKLEPVCVMTSDCAKNISDVIMKGLEVQIANRYQSMGEMAETLKEAHKIERTDFVSVDEEDIDTTVLLDKEEKNNKAVENKKILKQNVKGTNKKPFYNALVVVILFVLVLGYAIGTNRNKNDQTTTINKATTVIKEETVAKGPYDDFKSAHIGDIVIFGDYNGPIAWKVLSKNDNDLLLITDGIVDKRSFNEESDELVTWENSTLRNWLNKDFYNGAFTKEDKALIKGSDIEGNMDYVFLLSSMEVNAYCNRNDTRLKGNIWWTRSPVKSKSDGVYYGSYVNPFGDVFECGYRISTPDIGVRPVLHIDLTELQ